jgi:hypothetical protein
MIENGLRIVRELTKNCMTLLQIETTEKEGSFQNGFKT